LTGLLPGSTPKDKLGKVTEVRAAAAAAFPLTSTNFRRVREFRAI